MHGIASKQEGSLLAALDGLQGSCNTDSMADYKGSRSLFSVMCDSCRNSRLQKALALQAPASCNYEAREGNRCADFLTSTLAAADFFFALSATELEVQGACIPLHRLRDG